MTFRWDECQPGLLADAPYLGELTESEFLSALAEQVMQTILWFTEDGQPVRIGPMPVAMIHDIARSTAAATRAYDIAFAREAAAVYLAQHSYGPDETTD